MKCDNCKKWGKKVYDPEILYPEWKGKFRNHPCFCMDCIERFKVVLGVKEE